MILYINNLNHTTSDKETILLSFTVKDLIVNDVGNVELLWEKLIAEGTVQVMNPPEENS